ncbi:MAG TPA: hypothetical protein VLB50_06605 [Ignavibacteriaceae bacterium]|nr:hypothetical protein [Ignavibacteriaceae bacterium]
MLKISWCKMAVVVLLAFFFTAGTNLYAQDSSMTPKSGSNTQGNDTYKQNAQKWTDQLDQKLSLTEEQKTRIQGILVDFQQAGMNATADNKDQLRKTYDSRIESVLNDNQKTMYNSYKSEWWSSITSSPSSGTTKEY